MALMLCGQEAAMGEAQFGRGDSGSLGQGHCPGCHEMLDVGRILAIEPTGLHVNWKRVPGT